MLRNKLKQMRKEEIKKSELMTDNKPKTKKRKEKTKQQEEELIDNIKMDKKL
jgi:hypothetical protein